MEELLPFLHDNKYVSRKRIKSVKLFMKFLNEPSVTKEVYGYRFDFNSNGYPKLNLAFDIEGNIGKQTDFDNDGKIIKKVENFNNTATFQRPEIDTTIYEYKNGLLVAELEINESNYHEQNKKKHYSRYYKYDNQNRIIERRQMYPISDSEKITKFEYVNSDLIKEFDFMEDGRINMIIFKKLNIRNKIIEEKAVKTEDEYYDPDYKYQYFRHTYIYNNHGLLQEMKSFDNVNNMKSNMKYNYDSNALLTDVEFFEKGQLTTIWRFEYERFGFLNSIFGLNK